MAYGEGKRKKSDCHCRGQWGAEPHVLMTTASCHWKTHSSELLIKEQGKAGCGMLTGGGSEVSLRGKRKPGLHGKGWGISIKTIPRTNSSLVATS